MPYIKGDDVLSASDCPSDLDSIVYRFTAAVAVEVLRQTLWHDAGKVLIQFQLLCMT